MSISPVAESAADEKRYDSTLATQPNTDDSDRRAKWIARTIIVAGTAAMAWYTWGHWGDFQVDCGREIYVPAAILQGKLLFRDLWYMYGPLAPYAQAALFRIFGIQLTVLYLFGLSLTAGAALLIFEIAREFNLGVVPSIVPSLFFLAEAFYPFIFNFVFPYSYAASLGSFLGLACLYFALRYLSAARRSHLALAAALCGLVLLTKQEFGLACVIALMLTVAASLLTHYSSREALPNLMVCVAGIVPALAVYGWFAWKISPKALFFENWISTPGTYFMRVWGSRTMANQGFRFSAGEFLRDAEFGLLAVSLWSTLASLSAFLIGKLRLRSRWLTLLLWTIYLIPIGILLNTNWAARLLLAPITRTIHTTAISFTGVFTYVQETVKQMILPDGLFLFGLFFLGQALWKSWTRRNAGFAAKEAVLATYAIIASSRVMMETSPSPFKYAVFFNLPLYLVFVMYLDRIARWAARSLEARQRRLLASSMLGLDILVLFVMLFPHPESLPTPFRTQYGTFYTRPDVAEIFPQIISFMKTHTKNGKDILVIPEPPSLYTFAGMQAPSRWYSLMPGYVAPEQESQVIQALQSNAVRFVLIADRTMNEFGGIRFGAGYDETISRWITANYTKVGQFGPLPNAPTPPYTVTIYARNDAGTHAQ